MRALRFEVLRLKVFKYFRDFKVKCKPRMVLKTSKPYNLKPNQLYLIHFKISFTVGFLPYIRMPTR